MYLVDYQLTMKVKMRCSLLVISFFALSFIGNGQGLQDRQLFISVTIGGGNFFEIGTALNYTGKNGFVLNTGVYGLTRIAKDIPDDYYSSIILFGLDTPTESASMVYFTAGKSWHFSNETWFNMTAGLGRAKRSYPINFVKKSDGNISIYTSNYTYDKERNKTLCFVQRTQFEADVARVFGVSFGYTLMLAPEVSAFSVDLSILLGQLRNKREN